MVQNNSPQNLRSMICAVIVTRNPDEKLSRLLEAIRSQVVATIIVDNGTRDHSNELHKHTNAQPNVTLIENHANLGVATSLNQGLDEAIKQGFVWMITFDQDSQPGSDFVEQLCSAIESYERQDHIAIIAPKIIDAHFRKEALFLRKKFAFIYERIPCQGNRLNDVTYVITSGAMTNTRIAQKIGGFRDDFFIDYVDTEFCLRALHHGYRILVSCEAELRHHFGDRKSARWGPLQFFPSFHSPERWYTISRNRIPMLATYGLRFPHWLSYEIVATFYILGRMLLTESQRSAKLKALLKGTWDGLSGKMGAPPWATCPENEDNVHD
jgi:rhamnosyltransferase